MGDPKKTYDDAISQLQQSDMFTQADSTAKSEMLGSFFDTYGSPYLKSQGIKTTKEHKAYKESFKSKMLTSDNGSKKKIPIHLKLIRKVLKKLRLV
jgi:hypothetical protein